MQTDNLKKSYTAFDVETARITRATLTPDLICLSWFDGKNSGLLHWEECEQWVREKINGATKENPLVGHNVVFDLAVLANQFPDILQDIFKLLDRDAVRDTMIRETLIKIAEGSRNQYGNSLKDLALRYFDIELEKDSWRLDYADLKNVRLDEWPQGAKDYAIKDSVITGKIYEQQDKNRFGLEVFEDECRQNRANFALHLMSCRGVTTDPKAIASFEKKTVAEFEELKAALQKAGLVDENGKRDSKATSALMIEVLGEENVPRTPTGRVKTDEEACANSHNEDLKKLSRYRQLQTLINKDIKTLKSGTEFPIRTRFNVLLNTGRTSSSKPNLQNPRREPGIRECYVPRPGYVLCSVDYDSAELHTLAQVCYELLGRSRLREKLNQKADLHLDFAAQLLGISYEEALKRKHEPEVKEARQRAKVANFGFPGGMGHRKLAIYAKGYGLDMTEEEALNLRTRWNQNWPEMAGYFKWINSLFSIKGRDQVTNIMHLYSNRFRGSVYYTEACNSFFQGLAADGAKAATYEVTKACYTEPNSPLFGSRPILFLHDEIMLEVPIDKAHDAAVELSRMMVEEFNKWTPDVPAKAEPTLMTRWSKNAETLYNSEGKLIPWSGTGG